MPTTPAEAATAFSTAAAGTGLDGYTLGAVPVQALVCAGLDGAGWPTDCLKNPAGATTALASRYRIDFTASGDSAISVRFGGDFLGAVMLLDGTQVIAENWVNPSWNGAFEGEGACVPPQFDPVTGLEIGCFGTVSEVLEAKDLVLANGAHFIEVIGFGPAGASDFGAGAQFNVGSGYFDISAPEQLRTLKVWGAGSGTGTITSSPPGITCDATCRVGVSSKSLGFVWESLVTLTAAPDASSDLTGWSSGCSSTPTPTTCKVLMGTDTDVFATFTLKKVALTVATPSINSSPVGTGTTTGIGGGTITGPGGIDCGATCASGSADFDWGTPVALTATPDAGFIFVGWTGACTGSTSCVVTMNGPAAVSAVFYRNVYTGATSLQSITVETRYIDLEPGSSTPVFAAGVTPSAIEAWNRFEALPKNVPGFPGYTDTPISVAALSENGAYFTPSSDGAAQRIAYRYVFTLNATATASDSSRLSLRIGPDFSRGGVILLDRAVSPVSVVEKWTPMYWQNSWADSGQLLQGTMVVSGGVPHVIEVIGFATGDDAPQAAQFKFSQDAVWQDATVPAPSNYALTLSPTSGGTIMCGAVVCAAEFVSGTQVALTANAAASYVFSGWGGACTGTTGTLCKVRMLAPLTVTASFTKQCTITTAAGAGGSAALAAGSTATGDCARSVTVVAAPNAGYAFVGWTEGGTLVGAAGSSYTFTPTGDRTLTATFAPTCAITVGSATGGTASVTAGGTTGVCGRSVTVTAVPLSNFIFQSWTEGGSLVTSAGASYTFVLASSRTLTATFKQTYTGTASFPTLTVETRYMDLRPFPEAVSTPVFPAGVTPTALGAWNLFEALPKGVMPGYTDAPVRVTTLGNNRALFTPSSDGAFKKIAYRYVFTLNSVGTSEISFRIGPDFSRGGAVLLDGTTEVVANWNAMYWANSWLVPSNLLEGTVVLTPGQHIIEVIGFATGDDAMQDAQFNIGSGFRSTPELVPALVPYALTLVPSSGGTITCGGATCPSEAIVGSQVALAATPNPAFVFAGWGGACAGTTGSSCLVRMQTNPTIVSATFAPAPVATVVVNPATSTIQIGTTQQLTATLRDALGTVLSGRPVTWTTGNASIATVSGSGLVTAVGQGTVTITATSEGISSTATVNVIPVPVFSVTVTPPAPTIWLGSSLALTATPLAQSGATLTGRPVTWTSSAPGVVSVSPSGVVTALALGSATITATIEGKSGNSLVTVIPVPVATVTVTPAASTIRIGATASLTATLADGNGNVPTGRTVTWASSNTGVATVSLTGVVTAVSVGTVTITATSEGQSGTATVTVTLVPVASVTVSPTPVTMFVGATQALAATLLDENGSTPSGRTVTWVSSAPTVASVSSSGVVSALVPGTTTITATSEGISATATVTVIAVPVSTVTVTPLTATLYVGGSQPFTAVTLDANGGALLGRVVAWASSDPGVATVHATTGVVTAVAVGSATITATSEGKSGTAAVTVLPVPVSSVTVTPATATVIVGGTQAFIGTPRDASGAALTGRVVTWASSNTSVATVSGTGVVTAVSVGSATITATSEGKFATAAVTVIPVPVATVAVTPATSTIMVGATQALTATLTDANGNPANGRTVTWTSSAPLVVTVSPTGVVTAVSVGSATITATSEGKSGTAAVSVIPVPVSSVTVTPATSTINVGGTQALVGTPRDASGAPLTGRLVTWASSNTSVATVSTSGVVTAVAVGSATITATSEGKSGTAAVTVVAPAQFALRVSGGGTGNGMVASSPAGILCTIINGAAANTGCVYNYANGTPATLTANAASGFAFTGWSGAASCTGLGPCVVKVDAAKNVIATFRDITPPLLSCVATPGKLWPPNHKMVNIKVAVSFTDAGSGIAGFTLQSVTSSEPDDAREKSSKKGDDDKRGSRSSGNDRGNDHGDDDGDDDGDRKKKHSGSGQHSDHDDCGYEDDDDNDVNGDGSTVNDIQGWLVGSADILGQFRAERAGKGPGRVYTLTYRGLDRAGNTATTSCTVVVPHDNGNH